MTEPQIRMPDTSRLVISSSPHIHADSSVRKIMFTVIAALLPACAAGVWNFGLHALWIIIATTASCIAFEFLACRLMGRAPSIFDGSAALTGVLLALNLPPTTPVWVCVVGALIAIGLGKMVYGGLGYNPFNPALVARVALLLALPSIMTNFIAPGSCCTEAVTTATPLAAKAGTFSYGSLFLGNVPGCIGETSFLAILIGGIALIALKLIRWHVPVCFIGTVALITGIAHIACPETYAPPLAHVLSGGLALGAFFMATDMVTTPLGRTGAVVFAVGCGVITSVIRLWGSYPEGVSFSILIMNALTPLIDSATSGRPFGTVRNLPTEVKKA